MSQVVLIVDDDPVQRRLLEAMVQRFGYRALTADGGDAALRVLTGPDAFAVDCVILDLVMPDLDGLGVMARMRQAGLDIQVIVQTAHGGIDNVVSAMRAGATDFVVKPASPERVEVSLRNALAARALAGELQRVKRSRDGTLTLSDVVTRSPAMTPVMPAAPAMPGAAYGSSAGCTARQRSSAYGQRGESRQPAGRSSRPGTTPGKVRSRRTPRLCSGIAESSASV